MDVVGTFLFEIIVNIRLVNINKVARIEVIFVKKLPAVLDDINDSFDNTDVSVVIGANDVINPAARDTPSSPLYGMPILNVDKSRSVVVLKRSMSPGFAGVDNDLFYMDNTMMFFRDAKDGLNEIISEVKDNLL